jgi:hypothetical protein
VGSALGGGDRTALARLVIASEGRRIRVPDGVLADLFRRPLETLAQPGQGEPLTLRLAGPDTAAGGEGNSEILLVPEHPQTGRAWEEPGARSAVLSWYCWNWLASPGELRTDAVPEQVWRDDPPARALFRPDGRIFLDAWAGAPSCGFGRFGSFLYF